MEFGLSLGSNLGDRLANLRRARDEVLAIPGVHLRAQSRVYETEPVDVDPDDRDKSFLNAVLSVETDLAPEDLAPLLHEVESRMGRRRESNRNAPRVIDLDIIYAGMRTIRSPTLCVPHPRWAERKFVVQPLSDVSPDFIAPGETRTVREILRFLPDSPRVALFAADW